MIRLSESTDSITFCSGQALIQRWIWDFINRSLLFWCIPQMLNVFRTFSPSGHCTLSIIHDALWKLPCVSQKYCFQRLVEELMHSKTIGQWSLCCYIVEKSPGAKMLKKAKSFRDDVKGLLRRRSSASTHESAIAEAKHRHSKSYSLPTETPLENPALTDKVGIPSREKGVVQGLEPKWQSIDEVYFNTGPLCTSNIVSRL